LGGAGNRAQRGAQVSQRGFQPAIEFGITATVEQQPRAGGQRDRIPAGFVALISKNTTCSGYHPNDNHYGWCSKKLNGHYWDSLFRQNPAPDGIKFGGSSKLWE